jgi:hypothetical protein
VIGLAVRRTVIVANSFLGQIRRTPRDVTGGPKRSLLGRPGALAPAEVGKLSGYRPFSLDGGNGSKCPGAAIGARHESTGG